MGSPGALLPLLRLGHLFLKHLALERLDHLLVSLGVEPGLVPFPLQFFARSLLNRIELLVLLELVQGLSLLLNHISVGEWEIVHALYRFHSELVAVPFALLVLQDLVGLDEGVHFVGLILLLV